jgi:hypothetical protein
MIRNFPFFCPSNPLRVQYKKKYSPRLIGFIKNIYSYINISYSWPYEYVLMKLSDDVCSVCSRYKCGAAIPRLTNISVFLIRICTQLPVMPQSELALMSSVKRTILKVHILSLSCDKMSINGGAQASTGEGLHGTDTVVTGPGRETQQVRCYKTLNFHMRCRSSLPLKTIPSFGKYSDTCQYL